MGVLAQAEVEVGVGTLPRAAEHTLQLRCPACHRSMGTFTSYDVKARPTCSGCAFVLLNEDGVWNALPREREQYFGHFIAEYQSVRAAEGRGSSRSEYYLALPYQDLSGRNRWQWRIRSRSFRFFEQRVFPGIERSYHRALDVLDIGAGNCWLSYRLALRGHRPVAVDLIDNAEDGLRAARHYFAHLEKPFPIFKAEMDRMPFSDGQFDLAVFNASIHYAEDYHRALQETLRCLRRPACLAILDSPVYRDNESGRRMVNERKAAFKRRFGFASDSIPSREYLTADHLGELARAFNLTWNVQEPWYGLGWAIRPLKARLLGRREPSKFFVMWTEVAS